MTGGAGGGRWTSRPARAVAGLARWANIARSRPAARSALRVSYGHARLPGAGESVNGGMVKFQRLQEVWPNAGRDFNLLYLGSSSRPWDARVLVRLARLRRAPVLLNQNGVAYSAWAGDAAGAINRPMAVLLRAADHVIYQSAFCKLAADTFLGPAKGSSEILFNAVDTGRFTPGGASGGEAPTLVLGGSQYERYRVETALRTLAEVHVLGLPARLLVTGRLTWAASEPEARRVADALARELGVSESVEYSGPYTQAEAPGLLRRGHILLHTKVNDPCPGLVPEAMACGLPVVYSATGGVPELVGADAGVGVPGELSWARIEPPDPATLALGVLRVWDRLEEHREAARRRAVESLDLAPWLRRHQEIFRELLG